MEFRESQMEQEEAGIVICLQVPIPTCRALDEASDVMATARHEPFEMTRTRDTTKCLSHVFSSNNVSD